MYVSCNLPRHLWLKRKWTTLAMVIPGPGERRSSKPRIDDFEKLDLHVLWSPTRVWKTFL